MLNFTTEEQFELSESIITEYQSHIYFDTETGEVFESTHNDSMLEVCKYCHPKEDIPTQRSRRLSECRDDEELMSVCRNDKYKQLNVEHDGSVLFSILSSKVIELDGSHEWRAKQLAVLIKIRNAAMTSTDEIGKTLGVSKGNINRELQPLIENGFIKVFTPNGVKNKVRVILFNPHLFWKGDWSIRNMVRAKATSKGDWELDPGKKTSMQHHGMHSSVLTFPSMPTTHHSTSCIAA